MHPQHLFSLPNVTVLEEYARVKPLADDRARAIRNRVAGGATLQSAMGRTWRGNALGIGAAVLFVAALVLLLVL